MTEIIQQTTSILEKAHELLKIPEVKATVTSFISWISDKLFENKKKTQEKLALIEQHKADTQTIESLKSTLEFVLEDNYELQNELKDKIKEVNLLLNKVGVEINKTNTITNTGDNNKLYQDNTNSTIIDNSIKQTHSGSGDNVGGNKNK